MSHSRIWYDWAYFSPPLLTRLLFTTAISLLALTKDKIRSKHQLRPLFTVEIFGTNLFGTKFSSSLVYCWVTIFQHLLSIYFFDFMSFSAYYFSYFLYLSYGNRDLAVKWNFFLGEKNFSMTFCTGISSARIYRHKETFLHISNFWMILPEIIGFVTRHGNNITGQNKWIPRIREKHKFWNHWLMSQLAGVWIF